MNWNTGCNSFRKWAIGNDIRTILLASSAVTSYVANDIYPLVAPENVDNDFIIYGREKYSKGITKMGVYEDDCTVFITIITDNYDNGVAIADAVDLALTGEHTLSTNVKIFIDLADSTESFVDGKYVETLLFKIK